MPVSHAELYLMFIYFSVIAYISHHTPGTEKRKVPYDTWKDNRVGQGSKGHSPLYVGNLLLAERSME